MHRVARIITDSDYIKAEIISYFGFPEERISVANWPAAKSSGQELLKMLPRFWLIMA